ncbi:MAG: aminotransferase class I/II-fold pyridoxal phosphate-dependent enzyme [Anaerococcus vaginalis]|uniref:MalY/PatB family protein n=1 Tax=Anaerococcus vaginalis TaxID=33037 RepID=UPI002907C3F4|nr:aminotransferase class I/II-fold pyridoxal phosphate-dependent enzyme [Anaerococcus vaginalis]MDU4446414.1 aminotransferase class I/II-fold pyridoxal phosphate-dependent enzyme [Anaerococcus vaginalis]MDU6181290.1 aminotransferase class I/II-fold pyridoxal phosphate-dependent enzyme [Anaerococcus vaginalis]MDU7431937.1 aminotransferase class I/II-fold pyridoxal phosphate-dependent enzyme [Anaerococcus vaginalis]
MKFKFDEMLERHGKDAIAVDGLGTVPGMSPDKPKEGFDAIPMWVADMNFATAPSIQDAIIERVKHPAFGYFAPTDEYFNAIINWHKDRKNVNDIKPCHIGYENGVLGGVISALNVFCSKGDKVLVHSPTYIGFTMSLVNNGYNIIHSELIKDENGNWVMDYEDMEKKIVDEKISATIMCNPHNPTGRVWTKDELKKAVDIFEKHNVKIVSDEIWSDILLNGSVQTPTQQVSPYAHENTVALYAPSKTFNLAGLVGSYHIIYNEYLRNRILKESSLPHYNDMNVLSMHALIGAYSKTGNEWTDELKEVISKNVNYAYDFIKDNFKGVSLSKPEGTYMLFLDFEEYCKEKNVDVGEILKKGWDVGVAYQDGRPFNGKYSIRMNLALPFEKVKEALDRLKKYVIL